jgi:alkylated DNA nucleotide flippase Atl1
MDAPRELEQDRSPAEAVRRYLSGRRRNWPTDEELREAIRTKPFYWGGRPSQRFHVLRRLEESYRPSEPVDFGKASLTVEHVLPQRPPASWFELLAEETEDGQTPKELHDLLVHTLGNLTLTGENFKLSNHPFQRKQELFDSSALRMNQEIAAAGRWGRAEILARADRLALRAVELWPGPIGAARPASEEWPGWAEMRAALVAMPSGTWTTYGDIAELIGSSTVPIGDYLAAKSGVIGAYRVLTSDGRVTDAFQRPDGQAYGTPQEALEREGVPFDTAGRAHRSRRLVAAELATLLGKDVTHDSQQEPLPDAENAAAARRFEAQLRENQPEAADSALAALDFWRRQGGHLEYGRHEETSCFPMLDAGTALQPHRLWPLALYPVTGTAEVVFQYLKDRSPFDDTEQRRELLCRLNEIDGIELAEAKLELRPSFPLQVFNGHGDEICAVLEWFVHTAALDLARRA